MKTLKHHSLKLYLLVALLLTVGCSTTAPEEVSVPAFEDDLNIVTLLPKDAIPSIDDPQFYSADEADQEYAPDELVLAVSLNGDSRAYSTGLLSRHEIVNDTVGGQPIAVTW